MRATLVNLVRIQLLCLKNAYCTVLDGCFCMQTMHKVLDKEVYTKLFRIQDEYATN